MIHSELTVKQKINYALLFIRSTTINVFAILALEIDHCLLKILIQKKIKTNLIIFIFNSIVL
jgi:hypothetical protein